MISNKDKSNVKFTFNFKTVDYTMDKLRHYIAMTLKAHKLSK